VSGPLPGAIVERSRPWRHRNYRRVDASVRLGCPRCAAAAIVRLPADLRAQQPDGTTHACMPHLGGCGWGAVVR
jgi:hypothetical protein